MALKFDMGDASWARQMAYQQQAQTASTLGEDIGTAFGMGASAIAGKAKAKFGAKYAKALEDKTTKAGSPSEFRTELNKQNRQTKLYNKFKDNEDLNSAYESKLQQHSDLMSTRNSHSRTSFPEKADWIKDRISSGQHKDILREARGGRREEWFKDNFGNVVKGVAGAGLAAAATPFALAGSALSNIFKKKDKSQPITSDPTRNPYNFPIGDEDVPEGEQAEHDKQFLSSEGDAGSTEEELNQRYRDNYNYSGQAPTLGKTKDDYYTKGPVSMRTGQLAREEGIPYQMTGTNPLFNPNLNTGAGFPGGQPQLGLSTGTEEEMLANRELMAGSNEETGDRDLARIQGMVGQADSDDGSTPDVQDILHEVADLPANRDARQKIIDDAEAKEKEAYDKRLKEIEGTAKVTPGLSEWYDTTNEAKFGRFGEALGETVQGYGGVLGDVLNQGKKAGQYVWDAPNVEKFVKHPAREAYRDLRNTTDDIYDAYDDTDVLGYWKNVWNNSNILGYNK